MNYVVGLHAAAYLRCKNSGIPTSDTINDSGINVLTYIEETLEAAHIIDNVRETMFFP